MFGWDHCETGQQLIANWKLPSDLDSVVSEHHCADADGWRLGYCAELIKISCRMADAAGFRRVLRTARQRHIRELLDEVPARERRLFCPDLETLVSEVTNSIHAIESV